MKPQRFGIARATCTARTAGVQRRAKIRCFVRKSRAGTAAVELAVCLPVIFMLVLGSIVTSNAVFLKQSLTTAAFEAANVCATDGNTSATATTRAQSILSSLNVQGATVSISPTVTASTATGTTITVTCSAPLSSNSIMYANVIGSRTISATITIPHF